MTFKQLSSYAEKIAISAIVLISLFRLSFYFFDFDNQINFYKNLFRYFSAERIFQVLMTAVGLALEIVFIIAAIKAIKTKRFSFKNKGFLYLGYFQFLSFWTTSIFADLLSTKHEHYNQIFDSWIQLSFLFLNLTVVSALTIYSVFDDSSTKFKTTDAPKVSIGSRFLNRLIDQIHIIYFVGATISSFGFSRRFIFGHSEMAAASIPFLLSIYIFLYYFSFELIFGQTIGKMHNNSVVVYKNGNFGLRLLGQFVVSFHSNPSVSLGKMGGTTLFQEAM